MKNRNLDHKDHWATPPVFKDKIYKQYNIDFDPCPYMHDLTKWNGLYIEWCNRNYINPPYSRKLKEAFIIKALKESKKGKLCVLLLPVSTSTKIFHDIILYNATKIEFIKGRIPFIGINSKGQYVNWHLWNKPVPKNMEQIKNSGMHDSMIVIFGKI